MWISKKIITFAVNRFSSHTCENLTKNTKMEKKLLSVGALFLALSLSAQLTYVGNSAVITVNANTLVYNGGGIQVDNGGIVNNSGNVMLVGTAGTDKFITTGNGKFVLKFKTPNISGAPSSADITNAAYGQLYISGLAQTDITGNVNKEYLANKQGTYQQVGLPFTSKPLNTLSGELGKTFSNKRHSQDEILKYDNAYVVARNTDIASSTIKGTDYYMLGSKNLDIAVPTSGTVYTLVGKPFAEDTTPTVVLSGAASQYPTPASFGTNGTGRNIYNEKFNTYLQDSFFTGTAWTGDYARNIYQFSNPYLTNLDLSNIVPSSPTNNGTNSIANLQGIRTDPGSVVTDATGTYSTTQTTVTFASGIPTGGVSSLIIKPLQTFVIKLTDNTAASLNFASLRRFSSTNRTTNAVGVNSARSVNSGDTVKQLGVIAYNAAGTEMGRTYFVVYADGISGHNEAVNTQVQNNSDNVIGTFEESATDGGIDNNYANNYWLYINEANEKDFKGKQIPMKLYSSGIKSLKFEIRENANLIPAGQENLSSGTGFYYTAQDGSAVEVAQNETIPVTTDGTDTFGLSYGAPQNSTLATVDAKQLSRTQIAYNPVIDNYIVRFDPNWKKADIQVYDLSGKLVISKKDVSTSNDFVINLSKDNRAYIVTVTSEKGVQATSKIIR